MTGARVGSVMAGYRIDGVLGRGGMGLVYRAEHVHLRRRSALKVIVPELAAAEGFREQFILEARIAAALHHPNVVTIYDAGEEDGQLYIAMRYIPGPDLAAILDAEGCLAPGRAVEICRQVAAALDAAHAMSLIHRDVKPGNILVEGSRAFLTDFGLTKRRSAAPESVTGADQMVGTLHYVAPEQIGGGVIDPQADVYSLGCVLFHCLTGQVPFARDSEAAVLSAHLTAPPPRPSAAVPQLPATLDAIVAKALEKRPERRFGSCMDLAVAAREALEAAGLSSSHQVPRVVPPGGDAPDVITVGRRALSGDGRDLPIVVGPSRPVPGLGFRVLLVGLDDHTRAMVRVALAGRCAVGEPRAGESVLEAARDQRPDLVLLDWNAPTLAAEEPIRALRSDTVTRDAKVLLVIDEGQSQSGELARARPDATLATPFSSLQLQVKVRQLLGADAVT